jgi:hypothetical protein
MNSDRTSRTSLAIRTLLFILVVFLLTDLGKPFFRTAVVAAQTTVQYKVIVLPFGFSDEAQARAAAQKNEAALNDLGRQGWQVVTSMGEFLILKK